MKQKGYIEMLFDRIIEMHMPIKCLSNVENSETFIMNCFSLYILMKNQIKSLETAKISP